VANTSHRIEDNDALKGKVDEAMAVYDEYVRNQQPAGPQTGGEGSEVDKKDEKSDS
jgi:hypothetical protein